MRIHFQALLLLCMAAFLLISTISFAQNSNSAPPPPSVLSVTPISPPPPPSLVNPALRVISHWPIKVSTQRAHFGAMAVDHDMRRLFATHPGDAKLTILNLDDQAAREIPIGEEGGIAINPEQGKIFLAGASQEAVVLDRKSLVQIDRFLLDGKAENVAYDMVDSRVYITHDSRPDVWAIDTRTHQQVADIKISGLPGGLAYDAGSQRVFQAITDKNCVDVINPNTERVVDSWQTQPAVSPVAVALDVENHRLFVAGSNGYLVVFDTRNGEQVAGIIVAKNVTALAYDTYVQRVYCLSIDGVVSVVQNANVGATYLGDIVVHSGASSIAADRNTHSIDLWIAYSNDYGSFLQCYSLPR